MFSAGEARASTPALNSPPDDTHSVVGTLEKDATYG